MDNQTPPAGDLTWLSDAELGACAATFEDAGFGPPLNWFRNLLRNWQDTEQFAGATVRQPAGFMVGEKDVALSKLRDALQRHAQHCTGSSGQPDPAWHRSLDAAASPRGGKCGPTGFPGRRQHGSESWPRSLRSGFAGDVISRLIIQIVIGNVRKGRKSQPIAQWVHEHAAHRQEFQTELVDLAAWSLAMLSFAKPPAMGLSEDVAQRRWASKIGAADGFIFVSPEYNHGPSAVLKNALDCLYAEWNRKPAAFVSFGNTGGARAVEQLRGVAIELRMAALGEAVHIFDAGDKIAGGRFAGDSRDEKQLIQLFDSLAWWARALTIARAADGQGP
jgi:NAD(P)H-dependent FMN reductase